jgi:histidine triad (HIT) family protein
MECLFCKIIAKIIPAEIVYEDETVLAFKDIHPLAPVHVLVIPKKHITSINDLEERDEQLAGHIILVAKKIAQDLQTAEKGYKLLIRTGEWGGQEVGHIHLHLIGGAKLSEDIRAI